MTSMNAVDVWLSCARRLWPVLALPVPVPERLGNRDVRIRSCCRAAGSAAGASDTQAHRSISRLSRRGHSTRSVPSPGIEVFVDGWRPLKERRSTGSGSAFAGIARRSACCGGHRRAKAQSIGVRAITLTQPPPEQSSVATYKRYSALLQNAAVRRLCGEGDATRQISGAIGSRCGYGSMRPAASGTSNC